MKVTYLGPAKKELIEAAKFYNTRVSGLGRRFLTAVKQVEQRIQENPVSGKCVSAQVRRRLVRGWPYAVLYRIDDREIVVVAMMHQRREPEYWLDRL